VQDDGQRERPAQIVLESDPPRRLSNTWHTFTPELRAMIGLDYAVYATLAAEKRSRVTFTIDPDGDRCKLTVVHDQFDAGSIGARGCPSNLSPT
jgi:hypothetical protein